MTKPILEVRVISITDAKDSAKTGGKAGGSVMVVEGYFCKGERVDLLDLGRQMHGCLCVPTKDELNSLYRIRYVKYTERPRAQT